VSIVQLQLPDEAISAIAEQAAEIVGDKRRFVSKEALATHLGISERRIKTLREHGLPARKVGRDLYFDLDEVNLWIDREGR
jgi:biotin operon repressor